MKKKIALVAFNGEPMCFVHVLLNALEMDRKGHEVKVIIEGSATKLTGKLIDEKEPFSNLYREVKEKGLFDCVCQACAAKMDALEEVKAQGLTLRNEMKGHPSLVEYLEQGFEIITF